MKRQLSKVAVVMFITTHVAQGAVVNGIVEDESGARITTASVSLVDASQAAVASTRTASDGSFALLDVPPGNYWINVSSGSFADARKAVRVIDSGTPVVTLRLSLLPASAHVTVTAEIAQVSDAGSVAQRINVITPERIAERVKTAGFEIFAEEAGVEVQRTASAMGGVAVRGLLGRNVALYRDGVRYTTSAQRGGVSTFWNLTDAANVESAEVLRGPNSAQYGSDSLGGTVHLLSPAATLGKATGWRGEFSSQYYSPSNSNAIHGQASWAGPRLGVLASVPWRRNSTLRTGRGIDSHAAVTRFLGLPSTVLGERLSDTAWTQYGGMVRLQYALDSASQLIAHVERSQIDGAKRYDQLAGGDGNLIADLRNLMLDFGYVRYVRFGAGLFDQVAGTVSFNRQREERVNQGGSGNPAGSITHQYERTTAWGMAAHATKRIATHDAVVGVDGYRETERAPAFAVNPVSGAVSMTRPRVPNGARYLLYGAYLQDAWSPLSNGRIRLSGAVRFGGSSYRSRASFSPLVNGRPLWPDDSLTAQAVSGRVGAVVRIAQPLRVHATWSRGFRAPNMTDLGTAGIQGNGFIETSFSDLDGRTATVGDRSDDRAVSTGAAVAAVRPETSDNFDGGVTLNVGRVRTEMSAFRIGLRNTITSRTLILPQGAVGQLIGSEPIIRQSPSGAVFVPSAANAVLVRANVGASDFFGWEHKSEVRLHRSFSAEWNATWIYARDRESGLPPDLEGGVPPLSGTVRLRYAATSRWNAEWYSTLAGRQDRLSSLALADRRTGASRSMQSIASFFQNGARARGLVANGILVQTGETLAQVQARVLGGAASAPLFAEIPGYAVHGIRGAWNVAERSTVFIDFSNLFDKSHRGVLNGIDGAGRGVTVAYRHRF